MVVVFRVRRGERSTTWVRLMLALYRGRWEREPRPAELKVVLPVRAWRRRRLEAQVDELSIGLREDCYRLVSVEIDHGSWLRRRVPPTPPWGGRRVVTTMTSNGGRRVKRSDDPNRDSYAYLVYEHCEEESSR